MKFERSLAKAMWKAAYRVMRKEPPSKWEAMLIKAGFSDYEADRAAHAMRKCLSPEPAPITERALQYRLDTAWARMRALGMLSQWEKSQLRVVAVDNANNRWLIAGKRSVFGKEKKLLILVERWPRWWFVDLEPTRQSWNFEKIDEHRKPRSVKTIGKRPGVTVKKIGHAYILEKVSKRQVHEGFERLDKLADYNVRPHSKGYTEIEYHGQRIWLKGGKKGRKQYKWTVHFEEGSLEELVTQRREMEEANERARLIEEAARNRTTCPESFDGHEGGDKRDNGQSLHQGSIERDVWKNRVVQISVHGGDHGGDE